MAATDKLHFMFEIGSFVDYFTIPPMFVSIFLDRTWIGKINLQLVNIASWCRPSLPESPAFNVHPGHLAVSQCPQVINLHQVFKVTVWKTIKSTKTLPDWPSSLLCSSRCGLPQLGLVGTTLFDINTVFNITTLYDTPICEGNQTIHLQNSFPVHLLENSGDPPDFDNGQTLTYWDCVYFLMVTMSTVGYGDIYCMTTLGRAFQVKEKMPSHNSSFPGALPHRWSRTLCISHTRDHWAAWTAQQIWWTLQEWKRVSFCWCFGHFTWQNMRQASHSGVWAHHLWVGHLLPEGLSSSRQRESAQESIWIIFIKHLTHSHTCSLHSETYHFVIKISGWGDGGLSPSDGTWPRIRGAAQKKTHADQISFGNSRISFSQLLKSSWKWLAHEHWILPGVPHEPRWPGKGKGNYPSCFLSASHLPLLIVSWTFQLKEADACLLLANKYCQDPDAEDAANIMRVSSSSPSKISFSSLSLS